MTMLRVFLISLAFAFTGCAGLRTDAGFTVRQPDVLKTAEPWHGIAVPGDISQEEYFIGYVPITGTMPISIALDLRDPCREYQYAARRNTQWCTKYTETRETCSVLKELRRMVFRAIVYDDDGQFERVLPAIINPSHDSFSILLPLPLVEQVRGKFVGVIDSEGDVLVTPRGKVIDISELQDVGHVAPGLFEGARLSLVYSVSRTDVAGAKMLGEIARLFPLRRTVYGRLYSIAAENEDEWLKVLAMTSDGTPIERLVTSGRLAIGTPGITPVGLGMQLARNVWVAAKSCRQSVGK